MENNETRKMRTTARDSIWTVQKRIGRKWQRITETFFDHRSDARQLSNELNRIAKVTGRGPNRRYRAVAMRIAPPVSDTAQ